MAIEDIKMATQTKLAGKVADINRLINHRFTAEELSEKLRRQGALDEKRNVRKRFDLEKELVFAKANGTEEEIEKLQKELDAIVKPNLSWGTTMNKPVADKALTEAERVHLINVRNQKLNYENVRRAQLDERKAARKAAAAVARGEAVADPFMRVRTVAKTHHDVSDKPQDTPKTEEAASVDIKEIKPATDSPRVSHPNPGLTPKKKGAYMISYRNTDDENIAALDMDIDIDI
jgi:RNA polymerase-associated protein RTF1